MRTTLLFLTLFSTSALCATGHYSGAPITTWNSDGRTMTLVSDFIYTDPINKKWVAPKGLIIDGASIPQAVWSIIGSPYTDKYRDASIIHDAACKEKKEPWQSVHKMFYDAMLTSGVEQWRASVMYWAVYHGGPRWKYSISVKKIPNSTESISRAMSETTKMYELGSVISFTIKPHADVFPNSVGFFGIIEAQPTLGAKSQKVDLYATIDPPQSNYITQDNINEISRLLESYEKKGKTLPTLEELQLIEPDLF